MTNQFLSNKRYVTAMIENARQAEEDNKKKGIKEAAALDKLLEANENLIMSGISREGRYAKLRQFNENVKSALLAECLYKVYNESQGINIISEGDESIRRSLVNGFIAEHGAGNLLAKFEYANVLLSEFALLVNQYHKKIMEGVDKDNIDTFVIDATVKDDFFKDLNIIDNGEAIESIRIRVSNALDEFVQDNMNNKMDIEDAMKAAKEKIDSAKLDEVKESYEHLAKKKISTIRNRKQNVFGAMVQAMAESVMKNDALKAEYMAEGKVDVDHIVHRTKIMYTFLEMVNTLNMDKVNEDYISSVIAGIKQ